MTTPTRATRIKNPMSIRRGCPWYGRAPVQTDRDFCVFQAPEFAYRAAAIILTTYRAAHGINTVRGVITRWAPPSDGNDTEAYIATVCSKLGVGPDDPVDLASPDFVPRLMLAMTDVEAGAGHPFTLAEAQKGFAMAEHRNA